MSSMMYGAPTLKKNDEFKLHRKSWCRHCLIQLFLTHSWISVIQHLLASAGPTAVEYVETCYNQLYNDKVECLIADRIQL
jgi:hypothetical protein